MTTPATLTIQGKRMKRSPNASAALFNGFLAAPLPMAGYMSREPAGVKSWANKDGRTIGSLIQARDLIVLIPSPHLRNAHWEYATDLIYDAARNEDEVAIGQAYEHFLRALKAEGLI
jgi:hypothetical protein